MNPMETRILPAAMGDEPWVAGVPTRLATLDEAVRLLRAGEPVALPTETVYGLAADATSATAVARIFEAKARPFFDPLIVHLPTRAFLHRITACEDDFMLVEELASTFWPGPLTMVLPRSYSSGDAVVDLATSGLDTVAVRMSAHPVFQEIAQAFGKPLAAPSANRFGRISPTSAAHVYAELQGQIPAIVDAGPCTHGVESTIVAIKHGMIQVLRPGPVTVEELQVFADVDVIRRALPNTSGGPGLEAPGQLESHYAPRTPLRLLENPRAQSPKEALLAFREAPRGHGFVHTRILSASGDLREAASTLFAKLRELDELGMDRITAEPVPEIGLGVAIMDRLRRAACR